MDVHPGMQGITQEQLHAAQQADLKVEKSENVHFIEAWADPTSGKVFCLSEAPTRDAVQRVHERAGHVATGSYAVPLLAT